MSKSSEMTSEFLQQQYQQLKDSAMRLLGRREHSRFELRQKLVKKGWPNNQVAELLDWLVEQGWQSDERFAEIFVRDKLMQGQGALKIIAQATQQRGLKRELVEQLLAAQQPDWRQRCRELHQRKFGEQPPVDRKEWEKRVRFLQQRGFTGDDIFAVLGELDN